MFRRGRAGRTPADAREGPVPGRGVARRGSSLVKYPALPLPGRVPMKPGADPPEALHPGESVLQLPQQLRAGGRGPGPGEEAAGI